MLSKIPVFFFSESLNQNLAAQYGIRLQMCIQSYNSFRITNWYPGWENCPYSSSNGGKLDQPPAFFTTEWAMSLTEQKLRYLVARYGFCFEPNI